MEFGGNSGRDAIRVPNSGKVIVEAHHKERKSEEYVTLASVNRIMRSIIPENARIGIDVKETVQECVTEFIRHVTNEANLKCENESRTKIRAEDIVSALGTLGFENYVQPLTLYLNKLRDLP